MIRHLAGTSFGGLCRVCIIIVCLDEVHVHVPHNFDNVCAVIYMYIHVHVRVMSMCPCFHADAYCNVWSFRVQRTRTMKQRSGNLQF